CTGGFRSVARRRLAFATLCLSVCVVRLAAGAESEEPIAAAIRGIVEAGRQPLLRRADFADQHDSVWKLYEAATFRPLWFRANQPTPQAAEILRVFSEADRRALSPEDYDATRLRDAAARFDSNSPPATDVAAFDTALTVSVLRYVSDAHL